MTARSRMFFVLCGLVFLAAGGAAIETAKWLRTASARIQRKSGDIAALSRLASRVGEWKAAVAAVEAEAPSGRVGLDVLLREMFPSAEPDSIRETSRRVQGGWLLREAETTLREVSFEAACDFARRAETSEYGWRVAGLSFLSEHSAVGAGNVVFRFEMLERTAPSPRMIGEGIPDS